MCGRYVINESDNEIVELIKSSNDVKAKQFKFGEIFPSAFAPTINKDNNVEFIKWGVPFNKISIINSKSETLLEKPMWKQSILSSRCVIPCSGFYEWDKNKQKFLFDDSSKKNNVSCRFI